MGGLWTLAVCLFNPISTGHGRNQPIYECHLTIASRNRINIVHNNLFQLMRVSHNAGFLRYQNVHYGGQDVHHSQFHPSSQKWVRIEINPWVNFLCSQGMSCCDLDAHDSNRSLPFFPGNWSESALYCWNYWWHVVQRPRLLPFVCRRRIPPLGGTVALGARAASIDQVGSFKRVIVYGASAPHRGPLFKLVHVQHCFNLGN